MITYDSWEAADAARENPDVDMVCGVRMEDGSDRYFLLPRAISDEEAADVAFQIRHGRPVSQYERWLKSMVADRHEHPEMADA